MEPPTLSVAEICRETGLAPIPVIKAVLSPSSLATPVGLDSQDSKKLYRELTTPQPSKRADKIRSKIWSEGQRYNRPRQFPESPRSKTTRALADRRIVSWQLERTKVAFGRQDSTSNCTNETLERRKIARWCREKSSFFSKSEKEEAQNKTEKLINILLSFSVMPMQRPERIREIFFSSALTNEPVIILNWICPPGTQLEIAPDESGLYRSYLGINPQEAFEKDYRLFPRLNLEKKLVRAFERCEIPLWYFKLVADDNPFCLYSYALKRDGEIETEEAITSYARFVQRRLDQEIGTGKIVVLTVSEFLGAKRFNELIGLFGSTSLVDLLPFLPPNILEIERDVISKHTQLNSRLVGFLDGFVGDVIRQYGAEGYLIWEALNDNVIIAWNESTRRTSIIDSIRKKSELSPFPKFFVLHEKSEGKIKDNF